MTHQKKNEIIEEFDKEYPEGIDDVDMYEIADWWLSKIDLLSKEKEQEVVKMIQEIKESWKTFETTEEHDLMVKIFDKKTADRESDISRRVQGAVLRTLDDLLSKLTPSDREML